MEFPLQIHRHVQALRIHLLQDAIHLRHVPLMHLAVGWHRKPGAQEVLMVLPHWTSTSLWDLSDHRHPSPPNRFHQRRCLGAHRSQHIFVFGVCGSCNLQRCQRSQLVEKLWSWHRNPSSVQFSGGLKFEAIKLSQDVFKATIFKECRANAVFLEFPRLNADANST